MKEKGFLQIENDNSFGNVQWIFNCSWWYQFFHLQIVLWLLLPIARENMQLSIETSISHIKPILAGDILLAIASEKSRSNRIGIYEVRIEKENGRTGGFV
jgi:hypothetical protein